MDFDPRLTDHGGMRRSPVLRLAAVVGLALVLTGCGQGASTEPGGPASPPASTAPATTVSATPSSEGPLPSPSLTAPGGKATRITVTGYVTDGVESGCLVLTDEVTGARYSVSADQLPEIGPTTRATVIGTVDPDMMSYCQEGPVLVVEQALEPTG